MPPMTPAPHEQYTGADIPDNAYNTASWLRRHGHLDGWTLRDGEWWQWNGRAYEVRTDKNLRNYLGYLLNDPTVTGVAWSPSRAKLNDVIDALVVDDVPDPESRWLPLVNGMFDPATGTLMNPTPTRFVTNYLPYEYDPDAQCPRWVQFLESVWGDDPESIALLQEWFGYLVSGETKLHKALLMIGPKRSGKGTIMKTATALLGDDNTGALKPGNLGSWFGVQSVIGKSLALIDDMRLDGRLSANAQDTLLTTIAEGKQNIQRKGTGLAPVDTVLRCRIMVGTNVPPVFTDPGGALPSRFMYLAMTRSFYDGAEDFDLADELRAELSGVLNWALVGWRRLVANGYRFTVPASAAGVTEQAWEDSSPERVFFDECTREGVDEKVVCEVLYGRWVVWAKARGHAPGSITDLGKAMKGHRPGVVRKRLNARGFASPTPYHYVGIGVR
ncbi:DNA primase family protein [Tsukamurella tyrosinosolvens]|uniref:DNA primase family protein n=1 Tax=Tsukamurella tyrosinosolvens TaxID=57704 RepID=UPI000A51F091|nr:DNA primase family protein [Tsukamurella tyrosinosolvens]